MDSHATSGCLLVYAYYNKPAWQTGDTFWAHSSRMWRVVCRHATDDATRKCNQPHRESRCIRSNSIAGTRVCVYLFLLKAFPQPNNTQSTTEAAEAHSKCVFSVAQSSQSVCCYNAIGMESILHRTECDSIFNILRTHVSEWGEVMHNARRIAADALRYAVTLSLLSSSRLFFFLSCFASRGAPRKLRSAPTKQVSVHAIYVMCTQLRMPRVVA